MALIVLATLSLLACGPPPLPPTTVHRLTFAPPPRRRPTGPRFDRSTTFLGEELCDTSRRRSAPRRGPPPGLRIPR